MVRRTVALLLAALALSGCQSAALSPQPTAASQMDLARLRAEKEAGRISHSGWAERSGVAAHANVALTPEQERAIAERTQLARRVDAGEITPAQFETEGAHALHRLNPASSRT